MNRRLFISGSALLVAACTMGQVNAVKILHDLVYAFVHLIGLLGSIVGLTPEQIAEVTHLLNLAQGLLAQVHDIISDQSKSAAQQVLNIMLPVLDIIEPFAATVAPWNLVVAAAITVIPFLAGLFGVELKAQTANALAHVDQYAPLTEHEAEEVLDRYGHN